MASGAPDLLFIRRFHMNSFEEVFENIKQYIRDNDKIPAIAIKTWIDPLKTLSFDGLHTPTF